MPWYIYNEGLRKPLREWEVDFQWAQDAINQAENGAFGPLGLDSEEIQAVTEIAFVPEMVWNVRLGRHEYR